MTANVTCGTFCPLLKGPLYAMTNAAVFFSLEVFKKSFEPPFCSAEQQLLVSSDCFFLDSFFAFFRLSSSFAPQFWLFSFLFALLLGGHCIMMMERIDHHSKLNFRKKKDRLARDA